MSPPLVSVVIPAKNCQDFLKKAIDCATAQTYREIEIVVVDDGSDDGTWEWLEEARLKETRIKPYRLDGKGAGFARNFGIGQSSGKYVAFLDADDLWLPGKLDDQIAFHEKHANVTLSFTDYEHVNMEGETLGGCFWYWPYFKRIAGGNGFRVMAPDEKGYLFSENVIGTSTVVVRMDALKNVGLFDEKMPTTQDWDLWLRLALAGDIGFTNKIYTDYLVARPGSITSRTLDRLAYMRVVIMRYEEEFANIDRRSVKRAWGLLSSANADYYRAKRNKTRTVYYGVKALCLSPSKHLARALGSDLREFFVS